MNTVDCPACDGEGEVYPPVPIGFGLVPDPEKCDWCRGLGIVTRDKARGWHPRFRTGMRRAAL